MLEGEATVTDGDGLLVQGHAVRFAALDAPEFNQIAKIGEDDAWINHGLLVKNALAGRIGAGLSVSRWKPGTGTAAPWAR